MFESPDQQWRELIAHYAAMWDEELLGLAADYNDLTEMAKQVLRDEMKKRGLGDPTAPRSVKPVAERVETPLSVSEPQISSAEMLRLTRHYRGLSDDGLLDLSDHAMELTPDAQRILEEEIRRRGLEEPREYESLEETGEPDALARAEAKMRAGIEARRAEQFSDHPREYTWKVPLRDYENPEEARQRLTMLRREGIQCWFMDPSGRLEDPTVARLDYRIFVPADQLEEAEAIVQKPVPQDIIDDSKIEVPEFVMPQCPKCGSSDPALVGAEPSNSWLCEVCGNEWSDPVPEPKQG